MSTDDELLDSSSSGTHSANTADTSLQSSPLLNPKVIVALPTPFFPASLEEEDPNRQCPPLPSTFPPLPYNETPRTAAQVDVQTPDAWIKRDPGLIRLTGKHPFNTEGVLSAVFDAGFLTPAHLHVVRNHGAVPQISPNTAYAEWKIEIHGLVTRPIILSVQDLARLFTVRTLPMTLCCAGNRRKEQNVVRKSLGFDWGSAGVSTSLWTGVYLADILDYVGVDKRRAKHVIFEGADTNLPKGPYGTSQRLTWAMNREKGMLIAWAMNGLPLEPDHGFPVRLIVPGQIGGRMVKWLTRIEVSEIESNHYLHYWDNKVLPMTLTPEQARNEPKWWYDPSYIITELNVNSVIAKPAHAETLFVSTSQGTCDEKSYTLRGFGYAGGGRRVTRIEISLDEGSTWALADVEYPEDKYRETAYEHPIYGLIDLTDRDTCFCWCFWSWTISVSTLAQSDVVTLRAMDEAMNIQPRDMYLNATSMLNNWWFRVAIRKEKCEDGVLLTFEHPAPVGEQPFPGWMERMRTAGEDFLNPKFGNNNELSQKIVGSKSSHQNEEVSMVLPDVVRKISPEEMEKQGRERSWFVVNNEVYDATNYLDEHPGGPDSILLMAGQDATEDFMAIHSSDAKKKLAEYHIGTLSAPLRPQASTVIQRGLDAPFLDSKTWETVSLISIKRVNHDSLIYRFVFPPGAEKQLLGLPVGQHVFVRLRRKDTGEVIQRAYTPVSWRHVKGEIEFLIKLYLPCAQWPVGGKMSMGFDSLQIGDSVEIKGPLGLFVWLGRGMASWRGAERKLREIGMVYGGSGITPILQVLRAILHDDGDAETKIYLISANKTEEDILCREEIEALVTKNGLRLSVYYVLSSTETLTEVWTQGRGRVDEEVLRRYLPDPPGERTGDDSVNGGKMILSCGPPGMIEHLRNSLRQIGWDVERDLVVF
ncbi:hypothetical protein BDY19DRAFT_895569 [Irpex rosettiformis]|uniref:Uncharacterized protein n=1 Tax=Irpex rosettiformis TaxID=378272 RepID=A0ACB8TVK3_9APHY|nr:hypothetical protein BDY19DRAFT_895569 [Irpex rosettiformis]